MKKILGLAVLLALSAFAQPMRICTSVSASSTAYTCPGVWGGGYLTGTLTYWYPDQVNGVSATLDMGSGALPLKDLNGQTLTAGVLSTSIPGVGYHVFCDSFPTCSAFRVLAIGMLGPPGPTGPTGQSAVWRSGIGTPSAGLGNDGDMYLNSSTQDVYGPKASGSWGSIVVNIKGTSGSNGANGSNGSNGSSSAWIAGSGVPASGLGNNSDMYLNTSTSDVYGPKAAGAWGSFVANLKGATGSAGSTGSTGANGSAGSNGCSILNGAGVPASGTGANCDFYINTSSAPICMYGPKASGSWPGTCVGLGPNIPTVNSVTRTLNTCFQISSTQDSIATYSVEVDTSISLTGGAAGTVFLESYTNSGCTTGQTELGRTFNSQTGALTIGLNLNQGFADPMTAVAKRGLWLMLRTTNNTGTPTFIYRSGQEAIY